jgi:hypothetical protein
MIVLGILFVIFYPRRKHLEIHPIVEENDNPNNRSQTSYSIQVGNEQERGKEIGM